MPTRGNISPSNYPESYVDYPENNQNVKYCHRRHPKKYPTHKLSETMFKAESNLVLGTFLNPDYPKPHLNYPKKDRKTSLGMKMNSNEKELEQ